MAFALSCVRVDNPPTKASGHALPAFYAAAPTLLPSEDEQDDALTRARREDKDARASDGQFALLSPEEHMRRANVYMNNRAFAEAREHWQMLISRYPDNASVPAAYFGIGRSLFNERRHEEALPIFEKLGAEYPDTLSGRDGFYYVAATLLRMNRAAEAAERYAAYVEKYPYGERIENAHLNIIDSLREAGRPGDALPWIARTRERFKGTPTDTSALFARLRLDIGRGDWRSALQTSEELGRLPLGRGVGTSAAEVSYLRAYSLEQLGQKEQAAKLYQAIPDSIGSYYGGLATQRLIALGGAARQAGTTRQARVRGEVQRSAESYPAPYRDIILRSVAGRRIDPRLILSIMRQESSFNPRAKSIAAARGLMQFTVDTAAKYAPRVKLTGLSENDLYRPDVSILLAGEYLDELAGMFPGLPEAVAASYNGGEDNVARWVQRSGRRDPGIFTAEVGFSESKDYVQKVMANYRAYNLLYTQDLRPQK